MALTVLISAAPVPGATGRWVQTTTGDFGSGTLEQIAVLSSGRIEIAPDTKKLLEEEKMLIWCLTADGKGNLYAGIDKDGRIIRIDPQGKPSPFFKVEDLFVLSLATDSDGNIYAGTAPGGSIYKIAPDGVGQVLYKGSDRYIWAIEFASDGSLYAATGDDGRLLRISPKGEAKVILDTPERHFMALAIAADGTVYAASAGKGRIYRIGKSGKGFVLYEPPEKELRCLTLDAKGNLYVGTASGAPTTAKPLVPAAKPSGKPRPATNRPTPAPGGGGAGEDDGATGGKRPRKAPGEVINGTNCVYRIDPKGNVRKIFEKKGAAVLSLLATDDGLLVGTGNEGKIYLVNERGEAAMLIRNDGAQVTAILDAGKARYCATSNNGNVCKILAPHGAMAMYTSTVHDAKLTAQWGRVSWTGSTPGKTSVTVATRTGNVAEADETWTDWSDELTAAGSKILSTAARFIQYRITFNTNDRSISPQVDQVTISYITANQPPVVGSITVAAEKDTAPGQLAFGKSIKIAWKASDPNGDKLKYTLGFKGEGEKNWKPIGEDWKEPKADWDTNTVPDGVYRVKVTASDSPANPGDRACSAGLESQSFTIDNTRPRVLDINAGKPKDKAVTISAKIEDAVSNIKSARYSIDSGDWHTLLPDDGIFDTKTEAVEFTTEALGPGEHTIVILASDEAGNTGSGKAVFEIE